MDRVSLIFKVLSGSATFDEQKYLERWIGETDDNRREFEDLKLLSEHSGQELYQNEGFIKVKMRVRKVSRRRRALKSLLTAALVILVSIISFYLISLLRPALPVDEVFMFNDVPLATVIEEIEDRYHVTIEVADSGLFECRVTADIYRARNAQDVINTVASSLGVRTVSLDSQTYRLDGKSCSAKDFQDYIKSDNSNSVAVSPNRVVKLVQRLN